MRRESKPTKKLAQKMYLIDGVRVTKRIWERRQRFGEHAAAKFEVVRG